MALLKKIKSIVQKIKQDRSFRKKYIYYYSLTFAFPIIFILLANLITQQIFRFCRWKNREYGRNGV